MSIARFRIGLKLLGVAILTCAILTIILQIAFRLPSSNIPTSGTSKRFVSKAGYFSITYPEDWILRETTDGVQGDRTIVALIDYPKMPAPGVQLTIRRSNIQFDSLSQVSEWVGSSLTDLPSYQVISDGPKNLNGEQVWERVSVDQMPATPLQPLQLIKCLSHSRLHNRIGYGLTFCSQKDDYPVLEPTFQEMIESFTYQD